MFNDQYELTKAVLEGRKTQTRIDTKANRYTTAREAYAALIDKVSGKDTWEHNP